VVRRVGIIFQQHMFFLNCRTKQGPYLKPTRSTSTALPPIPAGPYIFQRYCRWALSQCKDVSELGLVGVFACCWMILMSLRAAEERVPRCAAHVAHQHLPSTHEQRADKDTTRTCVHLRREAAPCVVHKKTRERVTGARQCDFTCPRAFCDGDVERESGDQSGGRD